MEQQRFGKSSGAVRATLTAFLAVVAVGCGPGIIGEGRVVDIEAQPETATQNNVEGTVLEGTNTVVPTGNTVPFATAPVATPPVESPVTELPVTESPVTEPPVAPPVTEPPVATLPAVPPVASPPMVAPPAKSTGTMVPLYTYPTDPSWAHIVTVKNANPSVPVIAVVNPANGPGSGVISAYTVGIEKLRAAGIKVIGYVATGYTDRSEATVRADMDAWQTFYPTVSGIFFDEMANSGGHEDYYRRLSAYARSKMFDYTIGNPGADTAPSYVGTVDMILVYERSGLRPLSDWYSKYPPENFGVIPYGVPTLDLAYVQAAKKTVGYIYMTNDVLNNPWDSLPPYFGDLVAALAI